MNTTHTIAVVLLTITGLLLISNRTNAEGDIAALKESIVKHIAGKPNTMDYEQWVRSRDAHYSALLETSEKLLKTATESADIALGQKGKLLALENLLAYEDTGYNEYAPQFRVYADTLIRETPNSENAIYAQALLLEMQYAELYHKQYRAEDINTKEAYLRLLQETNVHWTGLEKALRDFIEKHPGVRANDLLPTLAIGMCRLEVKTDYAKLDDFRKFLEQSDLEEAKKLLGRYDSLIQNLLTVKALQKFDRLLRIAGNDEQAKNEVRQEFRQFLEDEQEATRHDSYDSTSIGRRFYRMAVEDALEMFGGEDWIIVHLRHLQESYRKSNNPDIKNLAESLEGKIRCVSLKGNEIEFSAYQLDGKKIDIRDFRGKVVLLDYWATWCGPCVASFPAMEEYYKKYREQGFEVIAYSIDKDLETLIQYEAKHSHPWISTSKQLTLDKGDKEYEDYYGINGIPHYILIGRDGKVISPRTHPKDNDFLEMLEEALQANTE